MKHELDMELGNRMKYYENISRMVLNPNMPILVRVDGKSFSGFTKRANLNKNDTYFHTAMCVAVTTIMEETGQILFAELHSDEASFLLKGFENEESQPYFGGNVQKISSVFSSMFTVWFNDFFQKARMDQEEYGYFDARAWNVPDEIEVVNYFLWRSRDCYRNCINDIARQHFSHRELQGVSTDEKVHMLEKREVKFPYRRFLYGDYYWKDGTNDWFKLQKPTFEMMKDMVGIINKEEEVV